MAIFNYGIDCDSEDVASALMDEISQTEIYQDGLDFEDERVSVSSNQALLELLKKFSESRSESLSVEVWPEDMEYDEAEESGDMEYHNYG